MNVTLLRQIADVIEKNPECHDQGLWYAGQDSSDPIGCRHIPPEQVHNCGTTACIAGWAVQLTPKESRPEADSISDCAAKLLELGEGEAGVLFSGDWSPRPGRTVPEELRRIADQQSVRETATAGDAGTATAGYAGTATAGDAGTATAGNRGTATAGERGVIVVYRIVCGNRRPVIGAIGETLDAEGNPLKPNVKYQLNDDGKFVAKPIPATPTTPPDLGGES